MVLDLKLFVKMLHYVQSFIQFGFTLSSGKDTGAEERAFLQPEQLSFENGYDHRFYFKGG
jgi:hypothetical protein